MQRHESELTRRSFREPSSVDIFIIDLFCLTKYSKTPIDHLNLKTRNAQLLYRHGEEIILFFFFSATHYYCSQHSIRLSRSSAEKTISNLERCAVLHFSRVNVSEDHKFSRTNGTYSCLYLHYYGLVHWLVFGN